MKVDIVVGTRPEAIKMAPVILKLKSQNAYSVRLISTGQHQELLSQALDSFGLKPDINLNIYKGGQSLAKITAKILDRLESLYRFDRPSLILGHGDTTTCFSAAMSAFYQGIPFGHIEAGYRTYNIDSPFPEEFNRQTVSRIARYHFASDEQSVKNLIGEGIDQDKVFLTGPTIYESIDLMGLEDSPEESVAKQVLLTFHRRELSCGNFSKLAEVILLAAKRHSDTQFVAPLHPNPKIQKLGAKYLSAQGNIKIVEPLKYKEFLQALLRSRCILTDSGGIQEEANYLRRPALILRERTERCDGLESGLVSLVGYDQDRILAGLDKHLKSYEHHPISSVIASTSPSEIIKSTIENRGLAC